MAKDIRSVLDPYLRDDAVARLRRYFLGPNPYTGSRFERFAGGGARSETASIFTPDDFVSVSMLGVRIHGNVAIELLEDNADELNGLLADIPNGIDLWDVDPRVINHESVAERLWSRLTDIENVRATIAGKLLARKRPRLLPVWDSVVQEAVGAGEDWWLELHAVLQDEGLRQQLAALRAESEIGEDISLLRILDVAIWMTRDEPLVRP